MFDTPEAEDLFQPCEWFKIFCYEKFLGIMTFINFRWVVSHSRVEILKKCQNRQRSAPQDLLPLPNFCPKLEKSYTQTLQNSIIGLKRNEQPIE